MEMALYGVFRDAGIEEEKAKAIAATIWKTQEQSIDLKQVATKADLQIEIEKVRAEIARIEASLIKWVIGSAVAIIGVILAAVRLMLSAA